MKQNESRFSTLKQHILFFGVVGAFMGTAVARIIRPIHIEVLSYIKLLTICNLIGVLIGITFGIIYEMIWGKAGKE